MDKIVLVKGDNKTYTKNENQFLAVWREKVNILLKEKEWNTWIDVSVSFSQHKIP